ncbi:MAG: chromosome segregation protein SMC [Acidimicrobiia bacterium]|nr:chromosome segregation protein SMC [Acidimicrobiia bacterium]
MFVKALRLHGFKSFADRTPLEFGPGITCVVGPNGSGKSNVVDALTWVMGVQGPRQLRGGRMEDVIFSGSPHRPALGRAEVELVLDNDDGRIPLDVAEVSIGRLLFRSGESRYTICGKTCRLVDIVELLSDAGVGRQMHNVVGQGRIDQILMSSPEERRVTIEEAAGVLKHRKRRERALSRLESVEADLVRLEDVHRELQKRIRPLRRQVEGAARHDEVSTLLRTLMLWRAGESIRLRRRDARLTHNECETLGTRLAEMRAHADAAASEVSALESQVQDASATVETARTLRERLDRVVTRVNALSQVAAERRRGARRRVEELEGRDTETDLDALEAEVRERLDALGRSSRDLAHRAQEHEASLREHAAAVADLDASWRAAGLDGDDRRAALAAQLSSAEAAIERAEAEAGALADRIDALEDRLARLAEASERARIETEDLESEAAPLSARGDRLARLRARGEEEHDRLAEHVQRLESEAAAQGARAESIDATAAGDEASRHVAATLRSRYGDLARVGDLVVVQKGAEQAVVAGLGDLLTANVVSTEVVTSAIDTVKATPNGSAVLADPVMQTEEASTASTRADRDRETAERLGVLCLGEVVRPAPGQHEADVASLLGRRAQGIFVARNAGHAHHLSRVEPDLVFVTPDGDRFAGGVLAVASPTRTGTTVISSAEARQRADLATRQAAAVRARQVERAAEVKRLRTEEEALTRRLAEADAQIAAHAASRTRLEMEQADLDRELVRAKARSEAVSSSLSEHTARRDELSRHLEGQATPSDDERSHLEAQRVALDEQGRLLRRESLELEAERARVDERRRGDDERLVELERHRREMDEREQAAAEQKRTCAATLAHLDRVDDLLVPVTAEAVRRLDHAAAMLDRCQETRTELVRRLEALRAEAAKVGARIHEVDAGLRDAEVRAAESRARLEAAEEVPGRELGVTSEVALAADLPEDIAHADVDERIASAERELKRLGPVNPLALDEFRELSERNDVLESELEDVRTAKRDVLQIVREVDRRIAEVLREAYADVGRHFSDLFALLFPGGEGRLIETDPEDVLQTGIEIEARPSGKSPKRLSLLSGGERSLSALAFLFAVFRARPSPFYVLDEVEAALDDINLHRFCNLLRDFRTDSQLVVVTHQKRTMETADVLLGVSLRDDGTSRLLSQRIADLDITDAPAPADPSLGSRLGS